MGSGFRFFSLFIITAVFQSAIGHQKIVFMRESLQPDGEKQIRIANSDGTQVEDLTSGKSWHLYPDIDSTGRYVAYVEGSDANSLELIVLDRDAKEVEQWTTIKGSVLHPDFSGDGKVLAFSGPLGPEGESRIGIINLQKARAEIKPVGGPRTVYDVTPEVISSDGPAYFPTLSSDGKFLVYELSLPKKRQILLHKIGEKDPVTEITDGTELTMAPALSFDDRYIAYTKKRILHTGIENWDIFIYDRVTKTTVQATKDAAQDFAPNFEPDGSLIYASDRTGEFQLYRIPVEFIRSGSFAKRVLVRDSGANLYAPASSGNLSFGQSTVTNVPDPARSSFGLTKVGDDIYVVGGHQGHEHTYPKESFLAHLDIYNLKTKSWRRAAPRPVAAQGFNIVVKGKFVYAFGGFAFSDAHKPGWKSLDVVDRYDTETDTWKTVGNLPRPRSSNVVARVGEKVYLIGGWNATPKHKDDLEGLFHREIDVFDLETEKVSTLSQGIPDPLRRAFTSVVVGNDIYLIGGIGQGASHFDWLDTVTKFNPVTNTWTELPKMPFATFAPAAEYMDGRLFVFGGMFKTTFDYVNHIFELPVRAGEWSHTGRYLSETKGFSMVIPENDRSLLVVGGHAYFEGTDGPVSTVESFSLK